MTPSKALFWFCSAFIVGIFFESVIYNLTPDYPFFGWVVGRVQYFVLGFLISGILTIITLIITLVCLNNRRPSIIQAHHNSILILSFCVLFLALGITRFQITEFNINQDKLKEFNDLPAQAGRPEKITLIGQIIDGPDVRDSFQKLKIRIEDIPILSRTLDTIGASSIVLTSASLYPEYNYLDKIKITGKLKTPMITEDFNYKNYLLKDGIYSVMDFPKTELVSNKHDYNIFTFLYEKILFFKEKLNKSITENFSPPHSSLLQGIILGSNKNMNQDLRDKLNSAGVRHITAVSGTHIIILSSILMSSLLFLGLWRGQAFYFSIILIWFYIILIGFPASGIRAAIMGSILLLAEKLGRQNTSSRVIVLAASIMLLQNPLLLFYDIGFQLSFLASMGIIHLKPIIDVSLENFTRKISAFLNKFNLFIKGETKIKKFLLNKGKDLLDIISVTLSAQILTVPIMVYNFGNISLIAPLTNLLIIPVVYWIMVFGFLSSILGIFSGFLSWIFYLPCWLLLTYFLKVIDTFYQPWAIKTAQNVSWIWLLFYYLVFGFLIWFLQKKLKPKFLGY